MSVTELGVAPERVIAFGDDVACRDVGGYLTRTGEVIRWRTVLRWDAPEPPDVGHVFALADMLEKPLGLVDVALLDVPGALGAVAEATGPVVVFHSRQRELVGDVTTVLLGVLGVGDGDMAREHAAAGGGGMRARLRDVRLRHGSMIGYAFDMGVEMPVIDELRARLLV